MKNENGQLLYVISGETDKEYISRTLYAESYEHAVVRYERLEGKVNSISLNVDLLTRPTADDYGVFFANCEQLCISQKDIV